MSCWWAPAGRQVVPRFQMATCPGSAEGGSATDFRGSSSSVVVRSQHPSSLASLFHLPFCFISGSVLASQGCVLSPSRFIYEVPPTASTITDRVHGSHLPEMKKANGKLTICSKVPEGALLVPEGSQRGRAVALVFWLSSQTRRPVFHHLLRDWDRRCPARAVHGGVLWWGLSI